MDGAVLYEVVSMTLFTRTFVAGSIVRRLARRVEPRRADRLARLLVFGLVGLVVLAGGCDVPADEGSDVSPDPRSRVVSLSPAMTTTLLDLAPEANLVGRTPWCRGAASAPVVGTLEGVDAELLVQIRPDVVLVQPPASGIDPVILALQDRLEFRLISRRLDGLADVRATVDDLVAAGVVESTARDAWSASASEVAANADAVGAGRRLLLLHGLDPFRAVGTGTYLDETIESAGAVNALQRPGWIELGVEAMVSLEPDVVVVIGDAPDATAMLDALPWRRRPVVVGFEHPDVFEPSTRIPEVNAAFRARLQANPASDPVAERES